MIAIKFPKEKCDMIEKDLKKLCTALSSRRWDGDIRESFTRFSEMMALSSFEIGTEGRIDEGIAALALLINMIHNFKILAKEKDSKSDEIFNEKPTDLLNEFIEIGNLKPEDGINYYIHLVSQSV